MVGLYLFQLSTLISQLMDKPLHLMGSSQNWRSSEGEIIPRLFRIFGQFGEIMSWKNHGQEYIKRFISMFCTSLGKVNLKSYLGGVILVLVYLGYKSNWEMGSSNKSSWWDLNSSIQNVVYDVMRTLLMP